MTKKSRRRDRVSIELFTKAAELFAQRGYSGTSLQDIADAMEVSRPALYRYINSKEDILAGLVAHVTQDLAEELTAVRERRDLDTAGRLRAAIHHMVRQRADQPLLLRVLILSESELPASVAPVHRRAKREVLDHLTALVREATADGHLRPVNEHVAVFTILGTVNWIAFWYDPKGEVTPNELADAITDVCLNGLLRSRSDSGDGVSGVLTKLKEDITVLERMLQL